MICFQYIPESRLLSILFWINFVCFSEFMLLFTTQQPGQNAFQITLGDGILPCMSRDLQNDMHSKSALFMAEH